MYFCKLKKVINQKKRIMNNREFTPENITKLNANEIFVFGSNLAGMHGGGAALVARQCFGAIMGCGVGLQGQSYAIPTMQGGVETIKPYVDQFIAFATEHSEYKFFVTRIGCGIAGFGAEDIAPLFSAAMELTNVVLPKDFVEILQKSTTTASTLPYGWDPEKDFLAEYRTLMQEVKSGSNTAYAEIKKLRVEEFRNTINIVNQGCYETATGNRYIFPDDTAMMQNTVFYEKEFVAPPMPYVERGTVVEVQNIDCLHAAVRLQELGYNPAVLNMASRRNPGGGVASGAGAQEETLFRRTNLFRSLYQFAPFALKYGIVPSKKQYPLNRDFGGIYTPSAIYFRDNEETGFALLEKPTALSFISVAGMNHPDITPSGEIAQYHVGPIKNKIRTIFRIGLAHGHDSLVLGALGCGAFANPPAHVARLFHEVMDEPEFKNKYRLLLFAILDDHNAHRRHNPEGNFKPFADEFCQNNSPQLTADEIQTIKIWKMAPGNASKFLNGEDSIPKKTKIATKDSWKIKPMPEKHITVPMDVNIASSDMSIVKYGHIPEAMEDHWFMYCDENTIRFYRSWTGYCIYVAKYEDNGLSCHISQLTINRNPQQYSATNNEKDVALFMVLLIAEYGGDNSEYHDKAFNLQ